MHLVQEYYINQSHNDILKLEKSKSNCIFENLTLYSWFIIF